MQREFWIGAVVASALFWSVGGAVAADQERARDQVATETQEQEQIFGSQMMTEQERTEYRAKMRAATTAEERERIRKEHHEQMKARATERGMTLPDEPPARGGGLGMGPGPGGGRP
jgi:hypothetical protein